jgi:hypothetical protein
MTIVIHDVNGEGYEINDMDEDNEWNFQSAVKYQEVVLDDKGGEINDN